MAKLVPGDKVRMTEALKSKLRKQCSIGNHIESVSDDNDCMHCSVLHVEEFGDCVGVVVGLTKWNNSEVDDGSEIDVRWQPSNLRYAYHPTDLSKVENTSLTKQILSVSKWHFSIAIISSIHSYDNRNTIHHRLSI